MSILVDYYTRLLSLTKKEQKILQTGRFDELDDILIQKRTLIDKIDAFAPQEEELAVRDILEILEEIKLISDANRQLLRKELEGMGKKIELYLRGRDTVDDYDSATHNEAAIFDLKA